MLTPASSRPIIVWFRDDLRLADHPALHAAAQSGAPVLCVYVLDEVSDDVRALGGAARWWLAQSLRALESELRGLGGALTLRRGPAAAVLAELAQQSDAAAVHWNEIEIAPHRAVADALADSLTVAGIAYHRHPGDTLVAPSAIRSKDGRGMRVFTPFWRRVLSLGDPPQPLPRPKALRPAPAPPSDQLGDWQLEPTAPDWAGGLRQTWTPGEAAAQARLSDFLAGLPGYADGRDYPDRHVTSGLSPHLRFGEISPRQVWYATRFAAAERPAIAPDVDKFLSELGWREFCRHLLFDHPDLATRNLQPAFDAFPWHSDEAALSAWQRGRTGYPIVDAGMREVWHSGVMHNRVRMVVGSFLVKHLLIDWRLGEQWFWDTLVDADPGSNPGNWQWVAGCGADAAPYFRVFNPLLQSEKFDAGGAYIQRWVPELAGLPNDLIHQPWTATPLELAAAGIELGGNYPGPIVDHKTGRQRALSAYAELRQR
ncbi:cryptochrome/photolyase family protein [Rhodopseudomonas palustris]|uniref:cryptochrome/photolyase family protein n=1 Tax=Rhodopseudomonas palustris TaxID=1076 RepID=UPI000E5B3802|nr:deoxyribodipyrimidine photo-lyase [Rhodopseudomonas palustris]QLH72203.1 deoxyribodipyrimidine photo-lyase [Rhodopseudomonas palustris]RHZ98917.1 deoxyribodipyrimidine photo-lyase [Rhodopseudomonas palustris]